MAGELRVAGKCTQSACGAPHFHPTQTHWFSGTQGELGSDSGKGQCLAVGCGDAQHHLMHRQARIDITHGEDRTAIVAPTQRIQRVGGRQEIEVDVRVLAATHVDLTKAIEQGRFREDLYFRLAVVTCKLPPLRERGDDVVLLAQDFLKRFGKQNGRENLSFEPQALKAIARYPWPGNVRELQNRIQRAVIMADNRRIGCEDLEIENSTGSRETCPPSTTDFPLGGGLKEARETLERELVSQALGRNYRNVTAAAKELGVSRPTFYELMNKLGISKD